MRRTHVIAVVALTLSVFAPAAAATSASSDHHRPSAVGREAAADHALRRAAAVLNGVEPIEGPEQDATLALRDLVRALPALDPTEREHARALLARPTSSHDPYGDSYRTPSKRTCSSHLCVHWVSRTSDAPPSRAWVTRTMDVMKRAWSREVGGLDYRRPASDGSRGGNEKLDVYLKDVGASGVFGYCAPERTTRASKWRASGYCVLDDDFARSQFGQAPVSSLKATAAHEFFHAIQFGYDYAEDGWFMEASATWMEERVFDGVNDNRRYLRFSQLASPGKPLDVFEDFGSAHYGNWVFFEYLSHRFGNDLVREAWKAAQANGDDRGDFSIRAIENVAPVEFPAVFGDYASANTAPGDAYPEGNIYPEGHRWPAAPAAREFVLTNDDRRAHGVLTVDHLASKNVRVRPGTGIGSGWELRVAVTGPARADQVANVVVRTLDGTVERTPLTLDGSPVTVPFDVRRVTVTVANAATRYTCRRGTPYSCSGIPRVDGRSFDYQVTALRPD
jgi:hypothetical protein